MEVPAPDRRAAERQERAKGLHEVMADAAAWFDDHSSTASTAPRRARCSNARRVGRETARAFGLGFAPDSRGTAARPR